MSRISDGILVILYAAAVMVAVWGSNLQGTALCGVPRRLEIGEVKTDIMFRRDGTAIIGDKNYKKVIARYHQCGGYVLICVPEDHPSLSGWMVCEVTEGE